MLRSSLVYHMDTFIAPCSAVAAEDVQKQLRKAAQQFHNTKARQRKDKKKPWAS